MSSSKERPCALINVSVDLLEHPEIFDRIAEIEKEHFTVVICGGGQKLNAALEEMDYIPKITIGLSRPERKDVRGIRLSALESETQEFQWELQRRRIHAIAVSCVLNVGGMIVPVDEDDYTKAVRHGFGRIVVFTTPSRFAGKRRVFRPFPMIEVVKIDQQARP